MELKLTKQALISLLKLLFIPREYD